MSGESSNGPNNSSSNVSAWAVRPTTPRQRAWKIIGAMIPGDTHEKKAIIADIIEAEIKQYAEALNAGLEAENAELRSRLQEAEKKS